MIIIYQRDPHYPALPTSLSGLRCSLLPTQMFDLCQTPLLPHALWRSPYGQRKSSAHIQLTLLVPAQKLWSQRHSTLQSP